jgi:hypothetical protein
MWGVLRRIFGQILASSSAAMMLETDGDAGITFSGVSNLTQRLQAVKKLTEMFSLSCLRFPFRRLGAGIQ